MKKIILNVLLGVFLILGLTGCNLSSKSVIGTWEKVDGDVFELEYIALYDGGSGKAYNDKEEFETTGYAPQPLSWEIKDNVLNITYTLVNKTTGYKMDTKNKQLISVDEKTIYKKDSNK